MPHCREAVSFLLPAFRPFIRSGKSPESVLPWKEHHGRLGIPREVYTGPIQTGPRGVENIDSCLSSSNSFLEYIKSQGLLESDTLNSLLELKPTSISREEVDLLLTTYLMTARAVTLDVNSTLSNINDVALEINNPHGQLNWNDLLTIQHRFSDDPFSTPYSVSVSAQMSSRLSAVGGLIDSVVSFLSRENNLVLGSDLESWYTADSAKDELEVARNSIPLNLSYADCSLYRNADILLIKQCLDVAAHLLEIREGTKPGGAVDFNNNIVLDTGMSVYIPATSEADMYHEAQIYHAGRPEAREEVVIPLLKEHLSQVVGDKRIAEMGPADGMTSTIRFLNEFDGVKIDAIEYDHDYYSKLVENLNGRSLLNPLHMSIVDYKPENLNSLDAFVALGAFTDFSSNQDDWVALLEKFRKEHLKPGGLVVLEEEVPPFYNSLDIKERHKALAIQRGHIIFNALMKDKLGLAEMEIKALFSSLSEGFGDYKATIKDFQRVFKQAGYENFQVVKKFPIESNIALRITPKDLVYSPGEFSLGKNSTGMDYYNYIFNQLLKINSKDEKPYESIYYANAMRAMNTLHAEMGKYKDQPGGITLLKENLGLDFSIGESIDLNHPENDKTGGVYVLVAKA
jgi:phospholipid N-methyltransferase